MCLFSDVFYSAPYSRNASSYSDDDDTLVCTQIVRPKLAKLDEDDVAVQKQRAQVSSVPLPTIC